MFCIHLLCFLPSNYLVFHINDPVGFLRGGSEHRHHFMLLFNVYVDFELICFMKILKQI